MSPRRRDNLINLGLLQAGAALPLLLAGVGFRGVAVLVAWGAAAMALVVSRSRLRDLRLWIVGAAVGSVGEWLIAALGGFVFLHPWPGTPIPGWLVPSWALLGTATAYALRPLKKRLVPTFFVGAGVGTLSLWAAVRAGEIAVARPIDMGLVAGGLGLLFFAVVAAAARLDPDVRVG